MKSKSLPDDLDLTDLQNFNSADETEVLKARLALAQAEIGRLKQKIHKLTYMDSMNFGLACLKWSSDRPARGVSQRRFHFNSVDRAGMTPSRGGPTTTRSPTHMGPCSQTCREMCEQSSPFDLAKPSPQELGTFILVGAKFHDSSSKQPLPLLGSEYL
eukprot:373680-Hanusia_phi.AAC.9